MSKVEVLQLQSRDNGTAFLNVNEEYGHVQVWGSLYERETYLLVNGNEFHLVQFDKEASQKDIFDFFKTKKKYYKVVKIEKNGGLIVSEPPA